MLMYESKIQKDIREAIAEGAFLVGGKPLINLLKELEGQYMADNVMVEDDEPVVYFDIDTSATFAEDILGSERFSLVGVETQRLKRIIERNDPTMEKAAEDFKAIIIAALEELVAEFKKDAP